MATPTEMPASHGAGYGPAVATSVGFRGYKLAPAFPADDFHIFVSSAGDCIPGRKTVRDLIINAYVPALKSAGKRAVLWPMMWEDALAQRVHGQTPNDIFVEQAIHCHATIVLLKTKLGDGTKEEVETLLELPFEQRKPLAVIRFGLAVGEAPAEDPSPLNTWVSKLGTVHKVFYAETGPMGSLAAHIELTKTLNGFLLAALAESDRLDRTDAR